MLFLNVFRIVPLVCALFLTCSLSSKIKKAKLDKSVQQEAPSKKPVGLIHALNVHPAELYFNPQGPFAEINQGIIKPCPFVDVVKSCNVYKHFATRARFDVVRLDENLAQNLADLKLQTRGQSKDERDLFLMREVEDLSQMHIFYVLADVRDDEHGYLTDVCSAWRLFLQKDDGARVMPKKIIEIDPDAETRMLFGPDWKDASSHKIAYRVTFPCSLESKKTARTLVFSTPDVESALIW